MSNVILSISGNSAQPHRLEGNVTSKDGFITIEYKEKGMVKTKTQKFAADDLAAYMVGEAGFVVALLNEPVAKAVGTLATTKGGATAIKTEAGTVIVNKVAGVITKLEEVDADSKEARAAERAAKVKVKVRGTRSSDKADRKSSREERRAKKSKEEKSAKSSKADKSSGDNAKKKKRDR